MSVSTHHNHIPLLINIISSIFYAILYLIYRTHTIFLTIFIYFIITLLKMITKLSEKQKPSGKKVLGYNRNYILFI